MHDGYTGFLINIMTANRILCLNKKEIYGKIRETMKEKRTRKKMCNYL